MSNAQIDAGRVRAWLLIKAKDPVAAAQTIFRNWGESRKNDEDYFVIRADEVDCDYNIVVPVDTDSDPNLQKLVGLITGVDGVKSITVAKVKEYNPLPSYLAHGYISQQEADYAHKNKMLPPDDKPGKIKKNSPGDNPWG
ncbi:MAG: hypothetical protein GQ524_02445 [Anaerolineales bacterium]|nr:hypothetical protein [Anaerolineales bacterium]